MAFFDILIGGVIGFLIGFFWTPLSKAAKIFAKEVKSAQPAKDPIGDEIG